MSLFTFVFVVALALQVAKLDESLNVARIDLKVGQVLHGPMQEVGILKVVMEDDWISSNVG